MACGAQKEATTCTSDFCRQPSPLLAVTAPFSVPSWPFSLLAIIYPFTGFLRFIRQPPCALPPSLSMSHMHPGTGLVTEEAFDEHGLYKG